MDFVEKTIAALMVMLIGIVVWLCVTESAEWNRFKVAQHCRVVGKTSGSTGFGVGSNGKTVTTYMPGKTGWFCDDGVTYWR